MDLEVQIPEIQRLSKMQIRKPFETFLQGLLEQEPSLSGHEIFLPLQFLREQLLHFPSVPRGPPPPMIPTEIANSHPNEIKPWTGIMMTRDHPPTQFHALLKN